jgi:transportin-3
MDHFPHYSRWRISISGQDLLCPNTTFKGMWRFLSKMIFKYTSNPRKISYDLHQVPGESRLELKNSLIGLLKTKQPRPVAVQLSIALADLALQVLAWKNVVQEMVESFGNSSNTMPCLLEFLKVLPEEASDPRRTLLTDEEFRARTDELLGETSRQVLQLLLTYIQSPNFDPSSSSLIFECFNSWLKEIAVDDIVCTPLLDLIFEALGVEDTFDPAVDCVCSVIRETRDTDSAETINALYPRVVALRPRIHASVGDPAFEGYTKIFAEAGESWHVFIARSPNEFRELVECVAECTALDEDLDVVQYTFYFWYSLKQMIVLDKYADARRILRDVYLKLIVVIIGHLRYPPGDASSDLFHGNREEEDKFRSFRHEIGDVLKDCCSVVGSTDALQESYNKLNASLSDPSSAWQDIEAPLFSMRAMAREVDQDEQNILPNIMKMLVQLPENEKIRYAATLVLGRYTEWTARHPEYLDFQLEYIISGFSIDNKDVSRAAAQALMHFCRDCRSLMAKYIEQLHPFYDKMLGELDLESLYEVTDGIAHIILAQPVQTILPALRHFGKPVVSRLVEQAQKPSDDQLYKDIADTIELLTIFVKIVRPTLPPTTDNPTAKFVNEVYPVVTTLLENHGHSSIVAERVSKFIKHALHSCGVSLQPIFPNIAETLAGQFERTRFGCYLWVSGALIRESSNDVDKPVDASIIESVWHFSTHQAVSFFHVLNGTDPKDIPDLVEDFFRLMGDVLMYFPLQLIQSDWFETSLQAALAVLTLEQLDPLTATLHYLQDVFSYGTGTPPTSVIKGPIPDNVQTLVVSLACAHGQQLTSKIVSGLIYSFPRDCVTDASSLLLVVYQLVPGEQSLQWLSSTLDLLPSGSVSDEEKTKLLQRVSTAMQSKDFKRVRTILRDFTALYSRRNVTPRSQNLRGLDSEGFSLNRR